MSSSELIHFVVAVRDPRGHRSSGDSWITILDSVDERRGSGFGVVNVELPRGIYTVVVERAGARLERFVRHDGPTVVEVDEPKRYSSVPTDDTVTSREYYERAAQQWSEAETYTPGTPTGGLEGSLFIFVRAPSATAPMPDDASALGLSVLGYEGDTAARLEAPTTRSDPGEGWIAFHARFAAGSYVLRNDPSSDEGSQRREMAIEIFADWQTQVFLMYADGVSFGSASVLMSRGGFAPDDRVSQAVDAALGGLQNGRDLLAGHERQMLLYAKFDNPMLGLVGAHTLVRARDVDIERVARILDNLGHLLGESADVRALRLIFARRFGLEHDEAPFEQPPMLRAGLEGVIAAAGSELPGLVPRGGLLSRVAPRRLVDSPWSTWRPVVGSDPEPLEWLYAQIDDALLRAARRGAELSVHGVAEQTRLPVATVAEAVDRVSASMQPDRQRNLELERLVFASRRKVESSRVTPADARRLFREGNDEERIQALGYMQGDGSLRDLDTALDGIRSPRSPLEQYQALLLAQAMVPELDVTQQAVLADTIAASRGEGSGVQPGGSRWHLSAQILAALDPVARVSASSHAYESFAARRGVADDAAMTAGAGDVRSRPMAGGDAVAPSTPVVVERAGELRGELLGRLGFAPGPRPVVVVSRRRRRPARAAPHGRPRGARAGDPGGGRGHECRGRRRRHRGRVSWRCSAPSAHAIRAGCPCSSASRRPGSSSMPAGRAMARRRWSPTTRISCSPTATSGAGRRRCSRRYAAELAHGEPIAMVLAGGGHGALLEVQQAVARRWPLFVDRGHRRARR